MDGVDGSCEHGAFGYGAKGVKPYMHILAEHGHEYMEHRDAKAHSCQCNNFVCLLLHHIACSGSHWRGIICMIVIIQCRF
jgi:hypothetical protein